MANGKRRLIMSERNHRAKCLDELDELGHEPEALYERIAHHVTNWAGSSWAFLTAFGICTFWLITGPLFGFADTWQLVINTGTTIITFLMVFLLQRSQNKEFLAIHLKLDELVAGLEGPSNRLIDVEDLSEAEVFKLHERYQQMAKKLAAEKNHDGAHSIEKSAKT